MTLSVRFSALSDVGRVRKDNQDSGYAGPHLLMVADGVGGAARGDVASAATIQQMRTLDTEDREGDDVGGVEALVGGIALAHNRISDLVADNPDIDGTSTTVVAGLLTGDELVVAHVGDSRAYLLRDGVIQALTRDHSFVQSLVDEGRITEDEARTHPNRNLILRAVDGVHEPNPDTSVHPLQRGDRLLFCSDGCCGVLDDLELAQLLGTDTVDEAARNLVRAALDAGSTDNVTVVVAELVDEADPAEEQLPILVGAAAHPLRPTTRPGRLRRLLSEPVDPELARYAPLPPRGRRVLRFGIILAVLLLLAIGVLYGAYRWTQTQYYIGADQNGYVTSYRGVPGSVLGHSLHTPLWHSRLKVSSLGEVDQAAVRDTQSAGSAAQARANIEAMFTRNCEPVTPPTPSLSPTPTPRPTKRPTATTRPHVTSTATAKPTVKPTATPTSKNGCPSSP